MQSQRSMRVEHALGIAGGSGGVAEGARTPLVQSWPRKFFGWSGGQQRFVIALRRQSAGVLAVRQDYKVPGGWNLVFELFQQRSQRGIHENYFVFGMIDDIGQLVVRQP